jgi:hypothetical protein
VTMCYCGRYTGTVFVTAVIILGQCYCDSYTGTVFYCSRCTVTVCVTALIIPGQCLAKQPSPTDSNIKPVAYAGFFQGGVFSTSSVEGRGQRERGF